MIKFNFSKVKLRMRTVIYIQHLSRGLTRQFTRALSNYKITNKQKINMKKQ